MSRSTRYLWSYTFPISTGHEVKGELTIRTDEQENSLAGSV